MAIVGYIGPDTHETKDAPLWWHLKGRQFTRSGYGSRIPTTKMVKFNGKWRRIYVCIWSNSGTTFIEKGKDWIVYSD